MDKTGYRLDASLALGSVEVTVADLDRTVNHHTDAIGLQVLDRDATHARLGVPGRTLITVRELPGAVPPPPSSPGLSHIALLVPTRADLARFARHYAGLGLEIDLREHFVSQSCYVTDPDGHIVEITCARPRAEWRWQDGLPALIADPMDLQDLLGEPGADRPFDGLPTTTEPAHVQLKVADPELAATEPFYRDLLGFEIEHRMDGVFLGFGVAGYRSLVVVTNRFSPDGGEPAPEHSARLLGVELLLPQACDVHALAAHLTAAGYPHHLAADVLIVHDPSGNVLRFTAGTA